MKNLPGYKKKTKRPLAYWGTILLLNTIALLVIAPVQTFAAPSDYRYCAPVTINDTAAAYNLLELTDEILGQTQIASPDLRIYSGNEEIPYALVSKHDFSAPPQSERAEILNQGKDTRGNLQFEVLIPTNQQVKQLTIISSDKNFIRSLKVEGSHNQQNWLTLTDGNTIFDLTAEHSARCMEVNLNPTNFPYLRITVYNEGKGSFHFEGVSISVHAPTEIAVATKVRHYSLLSKRSKDGIQEFVLDLLQPHLPAEELELITASMNFNRTVEIYASNNNRDWNLIAQGECFAYQLDKLTAKQPVLKFNSNFRYLKVIINNHDNPDLNIQAIKIKGFNPLLVFPADQPKATMLFWGNNQIQAPVYDIQKFKSNLDYSKTPRASLKSAKKNQGYQFKDTRPWTERNSWLLQGVLVIVIAVMLVIIIGNIRKISSQNR